MVMGGDSCSVGRGFKSQHPKIDGHFSHLFVVKFEMVQMLHLNHQDLIGPFQSTFGVSDINKKFIGLF